jgi:hypothetical protein
VDADIFKQNQILDKFDFEIVLNHGRSAVFDNDVPAAEPLNIRQGFDDGFGSLD